MNTVKIPTATTEGNDLSVTTITRRFQNTLRLPGCLGVMMCMLIPGVPRALAQATYSIWSDDAVPAVLSDPDPGPVELGLKFRSTVDANVTAIRFYKGPDNTGTHVGHLWTTNGDLLASVVFQNETASGWQQQALPTPVPIRSNTTYIVSYFAPVGGYSIDECFFRWCAVDRCQLRALADCEDGPNGVYAYGPSCTFPNQGWHGANYWVDVVIETSEGCCPMPPRITQQPTDVYAVSYETATFCVTATGDEPLSYQWQKNGVNLTDGGRVSGATSNCLTIENLSVVNRGCYTVVVTGNGSGQCGGLSVTSAPACLWLDRLPEIHLLSPNNKSEFTTKQIVVYGKADDDVRVDEVLMSVNGGPYFVFATPLERTCWWTNWVNLNAGTNTVEVKCKDLAGNESHGVHRLWQYFLRVPGTLTVHTNGNGAVALPNVNGSGLYVGRSYTVAAQPGPNWLFTNWTASANGGPAQVVSGSSAYTFVMQSNLTLTANFVTNRFIGASGMYYGLFTDETTPLVSFERSGLFILKTDSRQKFSGKLYLDGNVLGYSGLLDLAGRGVSKTITRKGKAALQVAVQLGFDESQSVSGTLVALSNAPSPYVLYPAAFTSAMTGFKAAFNLTDNPAANLAGTYTMAMDVPSAPSSPKGNGYGLIAVKTNGQVIASGHLGDYAKYRPVAGFISKHGDWPLYATAYKGYLPYYDGRSGTWKVNRQNDGMIWGWMKFTNNTGVPSGRNLLDRSVDWIKLPNTNNFYPNGFTNHDLAVHASPYFAPLIPATTQVLNITNGSMVFMDGNLPGGPFTNHFIMHPNSAISVTDGGVPLRMSIAYKTGLIKGRFEHPGDPGNAVRVPVGAVLQDENIARGVFKGTDSSGSFLLKND